MTLVLQAVKPTVNLLDAYGLRKDGHRAMGYWFNGCHCFNPVWTNKLPLGHVCLAGKM